ncbi:uncharacterized protein K444DRAFT_622184 [Hyaloscypha bicolor E]|uniref:Uncharacterized protein n=1 Tax=Hyaloscypha bicolor E TaxID=1095630 RepID=A0A2J6SJC9_9HELO|nr:uncharacterized protein K444DRAFT_622184 [Hyaloscypha bicolor E]PMD50840.1 hypothetical protein K444DRAFT_622184 [Hyaloscypha bicolor E]
MIVSTFLAPKPVNSRPLTAQTPHFSRHNGAILRRKMAPIPTTKLYAIAPLNEILGELL